MENTVEEISNGLSDEENSICEELVELDVDDDVIGGDLEQAGVNSDLDNVEFTFINDPCWASMRKSTTEVNLKTWIRYILFS